LAERRIPDELVEDLARKVVGLRGEYEFHSFWLGTRIRQPASPEEAMALKREVNRRVGLRVLDLAPDLSARVEKPDAAIILHLPEGHVTIRPKPLLVYGRYRKMSRALPQSPWHCRRCRGRGCDGCRGTGRRYPRSVAELVAGPLLAASKAKGARMHSTGREDVDARMLGRGRPFVMELTEPRVRSFDLAPVEEEINRSCAGEAEVRELRFADETLCEALDSARPDKTYRAVVRCLVMPAADAFGRLMELDRLEIQQETPRRVLHRRANRLRRRALRVLSVELPHGSGPVREFALTLRTEAGTYVKEFVSGDEGRTRPSVAEVLRVPCDCTELDVLEVHFDPPAEAGP